MMTDIGRDPSGQALVASDQAASRLAPTGFDPSRLEALAARCERFVSAEHDRGWHTRIEREIADFAESLGLLTVGMVIPDYTRSVDAALTLVPEGWRFYVDNGTLDGGNCHGCVYAPGDGWNPPRAQGGCRNAATPALAITAAALRAASAMEARQGGDGETRLHAKHDSAGPKDIAQEQPR